MAGCSSLRTEVVNLSAFNEDPSWVERHQDEVSSDREFLAAVLAMKRLGNVKAGLRRITDARIRELEPGTRGLAFNLRGSLLFAEGRLKPARIAFEKSHRLSPEHAAPLYNLSQLAAAEGAMGQAKSFLAQASKLQPRLVSKWSTNRGARIEPIRGGYGA